MRLSTKELEIIRSQVKSIFGKALVYLFGSRMDDLKKGGDIDLYVVSEHHDDLFRKKAKLKMTLEDLLFKPVDIVVAKDKNRLIEQEAIRGILL